MAFPPSLWPSRLFDQHFGVCITPHDFLFPFYNAYSNYYRPWKTTQNVVKDSGSTINNEKESFKVTLDVQHFRPNELSVKVANNQIVVEGRHEERMDEHGFISRHFTRRYTLPNDCMPEDVISNFSSDGVLILVANKKPKELPKNEKIVPIKLCKSCPVNEDVASSTKPVFSTDQKDKFKYIDASKNNTQIMLKEDHCCLLLKPELLRDAASDSSEIIVEKKKDNVEEEKLKVCQASKNTSEILEKTFAKASTTVSGEKCDKTGKSKMELVEHNMDKSKATMSKSDEKSKTSAAMLTSGQIFEQGFAKSNMSMSESEETFDLFDNASAASSTKEKKLEQTCEKSSAVMSTLSEKASQSRMTKSEISEITSVSSKTFENIESSTSFKASMASNIEDISEELSDFVSDILCSELDKTLDINK